MMTGLTILGFVLVGLGIVTGIWGGADHPIDWLNSDFMSYVIGAAFLITTGLALIQYTPQWLLLTALWLTTLLLALYLYGFHMPIWVFLSGLIVVFGLAVWLMLSIMKK